MNYKSVLKKEGINLITKLDDTAVSKIAEQISNKLCSTFKEHNLNLDQLFCSISKLDMYYAEMPKDSSCAKYFSKTKSIYFSKDLSLDEMISLGTHECLHFIQELCDNKGTAYKFGLYNLNSAGLAINEAAVQYMTSLTNDSKSEKVKYFNIDLPTLSPVYYPLECSIINQMVYFTGSYPLIHSTLYSDNVFKNTFISITSEKTYNQIIKNLDKILNLEDELHFFTTELSYTEKLNQIKSLNKLILSYKQTISEIYFETQNIILSNCFESELKNVRTLEDLKDLKDKLYNYKNIIGYTENYEFYNNFYYYAMNEFEKKREYINVYGEINVLQQVLMPTVIEPVSVFSKFMFLIKKLFKVNSTKTQNYNFTQTNYN